MCRVGVPAVGVHDELHSSWAREAIDPLAEVRDDVLRAVRARVGVPTHRLGNLDLEGREALLVVLGDELHLRGEGRSRGGTARPP
jgi:hypothetical protein